VRVRSEYKLHFSLKIDISCSKESVIEIGVHSPHRNAQLRMIGDDLIRGLPLENKGSDDLIHFPETAFRSVDTGAGIGQGFPVLTVCKGRIIPVFVGDRTMVDLFLTAVAYIRCLQQAVTAFQYEIPAMLVACGAGTTFDPADPDIATRVGLVAVVSMDAEIFAVVEGSLMVPVVHPVLSNFPRDRGRILTKIFRDFFERHFLIQGHFDELSVITVQMFLITRDQ